MFATAAPGLTNTKSATGTIRFRWAALADTTTPTNKRIMSISTSEAERVRKIPLTRGMMAIVDAQDHAFLRWFNWYALSNNCGKFYAARDVKTGGKRQTVLMHRVVLGLSGALEGEHENGNSLDNRRENLRPATRTQNHANRKRLPIGKSSPYRGVSAHLGAWTAQISINNKKKHLGRFHDPVLAARAYDAAARQQFGEFANLNNV